MRWVALAVGVLLILAVAGWRAVEHTLSAPGAEAEPVTLVVPRGASVIAVARDLESRGLVRDARAFAWLARWRGDTGRIHAGEYDFRASQSARAILADLVAGRVKTYEVSLPEGLRVEEVAERLAAAGLVERDAFAAFARDPASAEALGVAGPDLEGYLFPETYRLPRGLGTPEVASALVTEFLTVWEALAPAAAAREMDMRAVVTLASVVEKETGAPEERPRIAGVFHNRLRLGMRLESDPTTIYGIPDFDGNLTRAHLEDGSNPYNTYKLEGLPPGPIANPGEAALRAVLEPEKTEYLFFVSRNDGTHVFSRSYSEHAANVDRFQRKGRRKRRSSE